MLGKLNLQALQHGPIVLGAQISIVLAGISVIALLTYFKRWKWLWNEWLTSLDPKKNRRHVHCDCRPDVAARLLSTP